MRTSVCLALFLLACGAPPSSIDSPDPPLYVGDGGASSLPPMGRPSLSIASWNLEQFPRQPGTIDAVRELILSHDLDLIGVQEITDPAPFEALADSLPDHEMVISFDASTYTRVGFLYRPDRIRVGEVERLFSRDWYAFPRDPLMAELSVLDDEGNVVFDFTFVVVHLKAQVDEESRQRRIAAVAELDAWIRERAAIDPDVVVVGDFNDELTDEPTWNVFGPFLDAPDRYRFLTMDTERAGAASYIAFSAMIDHVLVTTDLLDEYGAGTTEVLEIDRAMPEYRDLVSDHRPVVARFAL